MKFQNIGAKEKTLVFQWYLGKQYIEKKQEVKMNLDFSTANLKQEDKGATQQNSEGK